MKSDEYQLIYAYTRADAIADGFQIPVPTDLSHEAGIRYPVYITRSVWFRYVEPDCTMPEQSEEGRLWDILSIFSKYASKCSGNQFNFTLCCQLPSELPPGIYEKFLEDNRYIREVTLTAKIGPDDLYDPTPAITILFPDED